MFYAIRTQATSPRTAERQLLSFGTRARIARASSPKPQMRPRFPPQKLANASPRARGSTSWTKRWAVLSTFRLSTDPRHAPTGSANPDSSLGARLRH